MTDPDKKLLDAIRRILRPVVRALIGKSIPLPVVIDLLKRIYVETAQECLHAENRKTTDSHISVMTGVHRKDVKELRTQAALNEPAPPRLSAGAELLARWLADPAYLDAEGKPLPIPYIDKDPYVKSFSTLASGISKDVRPRALLDDLVRLGAAQEDAVSGIVTLRADAFLPRENWDQKLHYFGQNVGDHLEAAVINIFSDKPPFMDRSVYHDGLSPESALELQRLSLDVAMKMLRQINRKAFELSTRDKGRADATARINLGVFYYSTDEQKGGAE